MKEEELDVKIPMNFEEKLEERYVPRVVEGKTVSEIMVGTQGDESNVRRDIRIVKSKLSNNQE